MKILLLIMIVGLSLSACSTGSPVNNTQSGFTESSPVQKPDAPNLTTTTEAITPIVTTTQPTDSSATMNTSTPSSIPASTNTPMPINTQLTESTSTYITSGGIVADHTVIDNFDSIPSDAIESAAAMKTLFMHQSTGNNIDFLGLQCLAGLQNDPSIYPQECITLAQHAYVPYDDRNWNWKEWDEPMADAIAKSDQWVSVVASQQSNYQVLGMKYCYVDGWNQDFANYRDKMLALEKKYPDKIIIWSTSALWNEPGDACRDNGFNSCQNIAEFNQQVRDYAITNNKPLYDLADIESHDPDGNPCLVSGYEGLCDVYYTGYGGGGGGHPNIDGSIRLAKGFWWLMARISGWDGN